MVTVAVPRRAASRTRARPLAADGEPLAALRPLTFTDTLPVHRFEVVQRTLTAALPRLTLSYLLTSCAAVFSPLGARSTLVQPPVIIEALSGVSTRSIVAMANLRHRR